LVQAVTKDRDRAGGRDAEEQHGEERDPRSDADGVVVHDHVHADQAPDECDQEYEQRECDEDGTDVPEPSDLLAFHPARSAEPEHEREDGEAGTDESDETRELRRAFDGSLPVDRQAEGVRDRSANLGEPRHQRPGGQRVQR
jgi:hypothetical protein